MGRPTKRPAQAMFFLSSFHETSMEPHEAQCGCSYTPTPSTSNFLDVFSSRIFFASSASLFLTTSFKPPSRLDQSQSSRMTTSSNRQHSNPAASSAALAAKASGMSRNLRRITGAPSESLESVVICNFRYRLPATPVCCVLVLLSAQNRYLTSSAYLAIVVCLVGRYKVQTQTGLRVSFGAYRAGCGQAASICAAGRA